MTSQPISFELPPDLSDEDRRAIEETEREERQELFRLKPPVGNGTDENGKFDLIPLSMLKGGVVKPVKVHKEPMKHIINDSTPSPRGWYKSKEEPKGVRPRPCYSEALLTTPYGGFCNVGCKFCYIDNGTRGYKSTGIPTANPDYPDEFEKKLAKVMTCGPAYMTSFSEPFQEPLEEHYHVTQRLTNVFVKHNLPIFYLSRRIPPDWALEALQANPYSYMQHSINTSNESHYKRISPGSYSIHDVLMSINKFHNAGIYISIQCNPILAGITSLQDILKLIEQLAQAGADHLIFKFVEQTTGTRQIIFDKLRAAKLPNVDIMDTWMTQMIGGVYTIREDIRRIWLGEFLKATRKHNVTMSLCYEYFDNEAAGSNMAPWFTTSDQCHGRAVPIHFRAAPGEKFQPLAGCYRKGCLYCADHGTKACNSPELLGAKALQYEDMRSIRIQSDPANWALPDSAPPPDKVNVWPSRNKNLSTDAELWGLGPLPPYTERALKPRKKKPGPDLTLPTTGEVHDGDNPNNTSIGALDAPDEMAW